MQSIPIVIANRDILGIAPTAPARPPPTSCRSSSASALTNRTYSFSLPEIEANSVHRPDPHRRAGHQVSRHFARLSEGSGLKSLVLSKVWGGWGRDA